MKESILTELEKAGPKGRTVQELSQDLDILKARVQGWFSSTGKKVPGLHKVATARWSYRPE